MRIVFAHFYSRLPQHLIQNLKRSVELFPDHQVILITDQDIRYFKIPSLQLIKYTPSVNWTDIEMNLTHPKEFRDNFWFTSLARFVAIAETQRNSLHSMLHVESDVLLASDFPFDLLNSITQELAFPVVSNDRGIASCLFLKNGAAADLLLKLTLDCVKVNPSTTDMHVLKEFVNKYPEKFQILPSGPHQPDAYQNINKDFLRQIESGILLLGGIFDGFDIGRFLFGDDPRNSRGFSVLRKKDPLTYLNLDKVELLMKHDREFPYVRNYSDGSILPIFALHIHCKKLGLFKINRSPRLIRNAVKNSKLHSKKSFSPAIFCKSLFAAVRRRLQK